MRNLVIYIDILALQLDQFKVFEPDDQKLPECFLLIKHIEK